MSFLKRPYYRPDGPWCATACLMSDFVASRVGHAPDIAFARDKENRSQGETFGYIRSLPY